jgi:hypothetical protein
MLIFERMSGQLPRGSFLRESFESMTDSSPGLVKSLCQMLLEIHEALHCEDRVALQPV